MLSLWKHHLRNSGCVRASEARKFRASENGLVKSVKFELAREMVSELLLQSHQQDRLIHIGNRADFHWLYASTRVQIDEELRKYTQLTTNIANKILRCPDGRMHPPIEAMC